MNKLLLAVAVAMTASAMTSNTASAQVEGPYGFLPYGFYQPYGARYGSSIRTPPYFATNPPVYYGARHARPYGLSPFAAPPMVTAAPDYHSRLRMQFHQPQVPTPQPLCNPYVIPSELPAPTAEPSAAVEVSPNQIGEVQNNPFVTHADRIARK